MNTREMAAWLAAIVESTDDAIIGKSLEGIITSWNTGAKNLYGFSPEETLGNPISMLIPPGLDEEVPRILAQIRKGERIDEFETMRMRKDGKTIPVSIRVSPVLSSEGEVIGASTLARDISERRRIQAERETLIEDLKRALAEVKILSGLLPVCAWCKRIRDDHGSWTEMETYIHDRSDAEFSHGICPECARKFATGAK